jgi:pimeloyl-ACP methyl ester carboxylesterase
MDSSATFQFVVDALKQSWHVIAPDWRGYGQSEWLAHPYWFPDYYADLHCILDHYTNEPARLVGHSMGANIASTYAGLRPERVSQLVMMDFLGLAVPSDADASLQLGKWLSALETTPEMRGCNSK